MEKIFFFSQRARQKKMGRLRLPILNLYRDRLALCDLVSVTDEILGLSAAEAATEIRMCRQKLDYIRAVSARQVRGKLSTQMIAPFSPFFTRSGYQK